MNKTQLNNIKSITKDLRWKDVEELLAEQVIEMIDMRNIDTSKDIEKQVYGRLEYADTLLKFLNKTKMIGNDPITIKKETFI